MRYRAWYLGLTAILLAAAVVVIVTKGFVLGIDFTGGTLLERGMPRPVTAAEVSTVLRGPELADLRLEGSIVQPLDGGRAVLIRTSELNQAQIRRVDEALRNAFGSGVTDRRTEVVGPVVGRELVKQALIGLLLASGGILVYVTARYEYRFGVAAIAALLHDGLVIVGLYSLLGMEVNVSTVAVVLTILGYSVNDTIVIFDRIREKLGKAGRRKDFDRLADEAITETLPRTLNTAGATLVTVLALLLLGGATIHDFALGLFVGIASGTYSSVFVASALWVVWRLADLRRSSRRARAAA
ncbi:protein translocase subunit SecF [Carboxydochorda subterranea]|uniref:Protein-export membrane protein SecF n=1 Tax=Carboxydichorda subterranea TaxID=3109565 RepID=A0ABZ1BZV7_9FIRM|nr:protein translocase subunit SecF [Limnochorda sp. L945t]WRP18293.1 protein translocase subunit SecF [Limnochorda sp. L945t]